VITAKQLSDNKLDITELYRNRAQNGFLKMGFFGKVKRCCQLGLSSMKRQNICCKPQRVGMKNKLEAQLLERLSSTWKSIPARWFCAWGRAGNNVIPSTPINGLSCQIWSFYVKRCDRTQKLLNRLSQIRWKGSTWASEEIVRFW